VITPEVRDPVRPPQPFTPLASPRSDSSKLPLVFIKENVRITLSPALLLPTDYMDSFFYKVLNEKIIFLNSIN